MAKDKNPLGLDPKKLRFESSDANFTTLRHKDGHQIRIAHNVLSPEGKKALAAFGKSATEAMTPPQAQQAQESNKANAMYAKGGIINHMPRGLYANGGETDTKVAVPDTTQPDAVTDSQRRIQQVKQGAQQSGGMNAIPSAEELASRLKNFWAEGGEVEPHNMPDNVTGYAEGGDVDESDLVHYSRHEGLTAIDPEKMGTSGVKGAQYKRGVPEHKSAFYYTKNSEPESEVVSGARAKYSAKLGPEHKVYDLNKDPEKAMEHVRNANQGAFNEDQLHAHLKSKGYHGVKWEQSPGTKVVQMYGSMNVKPEKMAEGGKVSGEHTVWNQPHSDSDYEIHSHHPSKEAAQKVADDLYHRGHRSQIVLPKGKDNPNYQDGMKIERLAKGGKIQKKEIFGSQSSPSNPEMREKHIEHIRGFAKKLLGIDVQPSGGKINPKTGERRDENPEVGIDKPDWRSGKLEAQWNPDAIVHELAHLLIMPKGIGLKEGQKRMDKQYADVQKNYGYMKQKQSQGEIQPMAVENMLRRMMGLPSAKQSTPVAKGQGPRMAVDTGTPAAVRVPKGEDKEVDLIRQARLLSPENRQRVHEVITGKLKFHPEYGWQENPEAMGAKSRLYKEEQASRAQQGQPPMNMPVAAAEGGEITRYAEGTPQSLVSPEDRIPGETYTPMSVQPDQPADIGDVAHAMTQEPQAPDYEGAYKKAYDNYKAAYPNLDDERIRDLALHETEKQQKENEAHEASLKATESQRQTPINMENARRQQLGLQPITEEGMAVSPEQMRAMAPDVAPQDQTPPNPEAPQDTQSPANATAAAVPQNPAAVPATAEAAAPGYISPQQQAEADRVKRSRDVLDEDMKFQEDLKNQHITPLTYSKLFHYNEDGTERSTLGKIGMAFSALISGAGAGLGRQAPAFMQIMNNEIANDLNAQMQSKQNAQNFLRIGQQQAMTTAQVRQLNVDSAMKQFALTRMRMNNAALHSLIMQRDQLGQKYGINSPQYQNADKGLAMINSAVQSENYNLADRYATNSAYMNMVMGNNGGSQSPASQVRQKQLMGVMNPEQANQALKEIGEVENHVQANNGMLNSFDRVDQLQHMSKYMNAPAQTVKQISAEWDSALDKFVKQNEGRVTPQTVQLMKSLKPKLSDSAETVQVKRHKLNAILNEGFATPTLDSFGIQTQKGEYTPNTTGQSVKPQYKLYNGVWYQRGPDGSAVPVK